MKKREKIGAYLGLRNAQASIITTILLIVLVLVAIIIVWNVVRPLVENSVSESGICGF